MATYAIGDIQGCFATLRRLLDKLSFDPAHDRLWLVGDLVNRGPSSAATLRWAKNLGDAAISVLGNHDLHLLTVAEGYERLHRGDTLQDILDAPDREEMLLWLRKRPLMHVENGYALLHAGLLPQWSVARARQLAGEVETALRSDDYRTFLAHMYGNHPDRWQDDLNGMERLRTITNALSRLRFCTPEGEMEFTHKGAPDQPPPGFLPWYDIPGRASADTTLIFGHWSALGFRMTANTIALDSGCLWGGTMTAIRLEDREVFQIACPKR
ncbi:MAG: symmetrical bis(5'-nucleosyl)-tetraphosphatase [Sulfuricellaceae bacterium]|nr:symmetrical bis(5'-nucleosyl)-tetraphosphatase [Sulfuricellaceae bacterium]